MQGIGIVIGTFIFFVLAFMPIIGIVTAKYITILEKLLWFGVYMLVNYILLKNDTNGGGFLFWAISIFTIFKIFYARRKAIYLEETNKT